MITKDTASSLGDWWSLSDAIQQSVAALVPNQDSWTLNIRRIEAGSWVFSLPQFLTFDEALCGGTELVIDEHFKALTGQIPVAGDTMTIVVSKVALEDLTTTLEYKQPDSVWADSSWYVDQVTGLDSWLCPYLQVLFKSVPQTLWVKLTPTSRTM